MNGEHAMRPPQILVDQLVDPEDAQEISSAVAGGRKVGNGLPIGNHFTCRLIVCLGFGFLLGFVSWFLCKLEMFGLSSCRFLLVVFGWCFVVCSLKVFGCFQWDHFLPPRSSFATCATAYSIFRCLRNATWGEAWVQHPPTTGAFCL